MISRSLHTTAIPSNSGSLSLWGYGLVELDSAMKSIMNVRIRVIVKPTCRIRNLIRIVVPFETRHHTVFPLGVVLPQVHRPCHRSFSGEITIAIHHVLQENSRFQPHRCALQIHTTCTGTRRCCAVRASLHCTVDTDQMSPLLTILMQ
jgi:hypothetical protein